MSEGEEKDLTKTVTVKRSSKKKSSYNIREQDGFYYVAECPAKGRVHPGDRIVGINGISSEEFIDEDDANDLIDSIRITVVPQDKLEEYDEINGGEEEEEEFEEYDRERGRKPDGGAAPVNGRGLGTENGRNVYHCNNCDHDNADLSEDEDGDLVCEECGHVIDPPSPRGKSQGTIHTCLQCGHENNDLEPDEDGDLVCQECGHVIPEQDEEENGETPREIPYECPDCAHITINPEPDDEGDRICEECGCILAEKYVCKCERCGYENMDPEPNEEGNYLCEKCGEELEVNEAEMSGADKLNAMRDEAQGEVAGGQEFDEKGNPITNPDGKKLAPADMFNPGDVITVTVGKSDPRQDAGLKIEERNGKYYVRKVASGGLFAKTPVIVGDKILELNGKDYHEYKNVNELKIVLKDEKRISVVVLRKDPDATESSASSINYDELTPITPNGDIDENDDDAVEGRDDDTIGYDGNDCGCSWCPDCK